jgi:hypothetical protein
VATSSILAQIAILSWTLCVIVSLLYLQDRVENLVRKNTSIGNSASKVTSPQREVQDASELTIPPG